MRHLSLAEIIELHAVIVQQSGGSPELRDREGLESSVAQPHQTFGGEDLYPSVLQKAAALCYFLVMNHPFVDGNKRVGHAALEVTLVLNGFELAAAVDEQARLFLNLASGELSREQFTEWVTTHVRPREQHGGA